MVRRCYREVDVTALVNHRLQTMATKPLEEHRIDNLPERDEGP
jgi:hypothetical protein